MKPPGPQAKRTRWRTTLRKFLYTIVFLILLALAVLFVLRMFAEELTELALVPDVEFTEQAALEDNAYQDPAMWFSRPGKGVNDPARWQPAAAAGSESAPDTGRCRSHTAFCRLLHSPHQLPRQRCVERPAGRRGIANPRAADGARHGQRLQSRE